MRRQGITLLLSAFIAGALLAGVFIYRTHVAAVDRQRIAAVNHRTDVAVCKRIHILVTTIKDQIVQSASRRELLKTSYYRDHRDEIPAAQKRSSAFVQRLDNRGDCHPGSIPKGQ